LIPLFSGGGHDPAGQRHVLAFFLFAEQCSACPFTRRKKGRGICRRPLPSQVRGAAWVFWWLCWLPGASWGGGVWAGVAFVEPGLVAVIAWLLRRCTGSQMRRGTERLGLVQQMCRLVCWQPLLGCFGGYAISRHFPTSTKTYQSSRTQDPPDRGPQRSRGTNAARPQSGRECGRSTCEDGPSRERRWQGRAPAT